MDIREWILDYGIPQDFSLSDAIQLIAAYEDEYAPKFGRLGTKVSQPSIEADAKPQMMQCLNCGGWHLLNGVCPQCNNSTA